MQPQLRQPQLLLLLLQSRQQFRQLPIKPQLLQLILRLRPTLLLLALLTLRFARPPLEAIPSYQVI
jgi:hypothetical protein